MKEIRKEIVSWIKDWFADKNEAPAIIGISGGKDSTVCAALLVEALGKDRVIGVLMPNGEQKDISDSLKVCEVLGIKHFTANIGKAYEELTKEILAHTIGSVDKSDAPALYATNTPARLRMATLYGVAAIFNGFVVNTCNLSEDYVGYSTKWGDAVGDFSLLNKLTKTEVVELGDELGLPSELVHKVPSDGMCGKSDEDNMGFTYEQLDRYIKAKSLKEVSDIPDCVIERIKQMHHNPNSKKKCVELDSPLPDRPTAFE